MENGKQTGSYRRAILVKAAEVALTAIAAGAVAGVGLLWSMPTTLAKADGKVDLLRNDHVHDFLSVRNTHDHDVRSLREKIGELASAIAEMPSIKTDVGVVKSQVGELKAGQTEALKRLERITDILIDHHDRKTQ